MKSNPQRWDLSLSQCRVVSCAPRDILLFEIVEHIRIVADELWIRFKDCHLRGISSHSCSKNGTPYRRDFLEFPETSNSSVSDRDLDKLDRRILQREVRSSDVRLNEMKTVTRVRVPMPVTMEAHDVCACVALSRKIQRPLREAGEHFDKI